MNNSFSVPAILSHLGRCQVAVVRTGLRGASQATRVNVRAAGSVGPLPRGGVLWGSVEKGLGMHTQEEQLERQEESAETVVLWSGLEANSHGEG